MGCYLLSVCPFTEQDLCPILAGGQDDNARSVRLRAGVTDYGCECMEKGGSAPGPRVRVLLREEDGQEGAGLVGAGRAVGEGVLQLLQRPEPEEQLQEG